MFSRGLAALLHPGIAAVDELGMLALLQRGGGEEDPEDPYLSDLLLVLGAVHTRRGGCSVCKHEELAREVVCSMRTSLQVQQLLRETAHHPHSAV